MDVHSRAWMAACLCCGLLPAGCGADSRQFLTRGLSRGGEAETQVHREDFQQTRSTAAVKWLLSQRVEQGMSPGDVGKLLGEAGERIYEDQWVKSGDSGYQVGDVTYKWGPDDHGNSYYLLFRDNHLVTFDASQYE